MKSEKLSIHAQDFNKLQKTLEFLAGYKMADSDLALMYELLEYREVPRRTMILRAGEKCSEFYYIIEGLTRQYYLDLQGREVTRGFAAEDEFCCSEVRIQCGQSSAYAIEALEDCRFLTFRSEILPKLSESRFFIDAYINALERDLRDRMNRDSSFLMESALERYNRFKTEHFNIFDRVKQVHLASYLGITPESLSRIRKSINQ